MRAYMRNGHRLAENVRALQMSPLVLGVGPLPCRASRGSFLRPSLTQHRVLLREAQLRSPFERECQMAMTILPRA